MEKVIFFLKNKEKQENVENIFVFAYFHTLLSLSFVAQRLLVVKTYDFFIIIYIFKSDKISTTLYANCTLIGNFNI